MIFFHLSEKLNKSCRRNDVERKSYTSIHRPYAQNIVSFMAYSILSTWSYYKIIIEIITATNSFRFINSILLCISKEKEREDKRNDIIDNVYFSVIFKHRHSLTVHLCKHFMMYTCQLIKTLIRRAMTHTNIK